MALSVGNFITNVAIVLFLIYVSHTSYTMYTLFNPQECDTNKEGASNCLPRYQGGTKSGLNLQLRVYSSLSDSKRPSEKQLDKILDIPKLNTSQEQSWTVNVTLPPKTQKNGTLYVHVFLQASHESKLDSHMSSYQNLPLTKYAPPKSEAFNLLNSDGKENTSDAVSEVPISHWRPKLSVRTVTDPITFFRFQIPPDIYKFLKLTPKGDSYLPILYLHELAQKLSDLQPINASTSQMELTIDYSPFSIGQLRLFSNLEEGMETMYTMGFKEKDVEEVTSIFTDISLLLLATTIFVSFFHLLFDFLAFKNDISYWRNRDSMVGLSVRTVSWRCVSQVIVFLYLKNEDTSMLVLVPCGIGAIIEVWKVKKAFKAELIWSGWRPRLSFGTSSSSEKATEEFDSTAMKYLSYILYPLCLLGAVYSLIYVPHKSWYSWLINSLVNGVYAFGFLFMLPQLFVNYKLKSVAHLPWRAFMYKAFNTFIDDLFAFIITMPTAHRVACFRDDIVFVIFLYQRWLYPVDKTRVNEFGVSFEDGDKEHED